MRLPDPVRSRIILIGTAAHTSESGLPDLPAVSNNLTDLAAALVDLDYGLPGAPQPRVIRNPENPHDLGVLVTELASEAEDLLLVYYAGHGLLDARGNLYLALPGTRKTMLRYTAFPFEGLREAIVDSPAKNRVLILDCCYSGRAIDTMSDPDAPAYDQIDITGTYTLTATTATALALAPEGAHHTAFTGELITLLRQGSPDAPDPLTLDHIYRHLHRALTRAGLPRPQQRGTDMAAHLALARNRAYLEAAPTAAHIAQRRVEANRIGYAGDFEQAARLLGQIVEASTKALGPDHRETLGSRNDRAHWVGEAGDAKQAVELFDQLVQDETRVQGPDHPETLAVRGNYAHRIGEAGDAQLAARLFDRIVQDSARALGLNHSGTLAFRCSYAHWVGEAGDARLATRLFNLVVEESTEVLGFDHKDTLVSRQHHASWMGKTGDAQSAARLCNQILQDSTKVLGPDNPDTLASRHNAAHWLGAAGDAQLAAQSFEQLVQDTSRVLGPDHRTTLGCRHHHARWIGEAGDAGLAARLFEHIVKDRARVLGPDHPDTWKSQHNYAYWTGEAERAT